jgi:hypothetical protein
MTERKVIVLLPLVTNVGAVFLDNPALQGADKPLTTTIQLETLGGDIYQLPLSAKGLNDLARVIGGLDEARQALGVVGSDKEPSKH